MNHREMPQEHEELQRYMNRVREAYETIREFEAWQSSVPAIPEPAKALAETSVAVGGGVRNFRGMGLKEAALRILEEHPEEVFRAREVRDILEEGGMVFTSPRPDLSISRCFSKAMKDGKVAKQGRGLWQWKPSSPTEAIDCGMCDKEATGRMTEDGVWEIICDGCGEYEITSQALAHIDEGLPPALLNWIRNRVRSMAEDGELPKVTLKMLNSWHPDDDLPF